MSFYVYIIYSASLDMYYTGSCENIDLRIYRHNNKSGAATTKKAEDWQLMYKEIFDTRVLAEKREKQIKNKKSKRYIQWLISSVE
ncbi:MAG: GIY-YIG nuclease family protein [Ferruginibacter sp.]